MNKQTIFRFHDKNYHERISVTKKILNENYHDRIFVTKKTLNGLAI